MSSLQQPQELKFKKTLHSRFFTDKENIPLNFFFFSDPALCVPTSVFHPWISKDISLQFVQITAQPSCHEQATTAMMITALTVANRPQ